MDDDRKREQSAKSRHEADRIGIRLARLCYPEAVKRRYRGTFLRAYVQGVVVSVGFEVHDPVDSQDIARQFLRFAHDFAAECGVDCR